MTKFIKFIAVLAAIICTLVLFMFYGNPVSKFLANKNAKEYLQENYQDTDFEIGIVDYDFKTGNYYVRIKSPSSADSSFTLYAGANGKIGYDSYEDAVVEKWNTAYRINADYREAVDSVLSRPDFPYDSDIGFGDIEFANSDALADEATPDYAVNTESLELDGVYDANEFGAKAGHMTIYVYDDVVSYERLSEIVLDIRNIMDEADVAFYAIDCVLEYPKPEDGSEWKEGRAEVMGFLYSDIYEEGLTERIKENGKKTEEYYKEQDAIKQQELEAYEESLKE